jgi:hypothetical protein
MMTKLCELEAPSPGKGVRARKRVVVMLGQTEIMAGGGGSVGPICPTQYGCHRMAVNTVLKLILLCFYSTKDCWAKWLDTFGVGFAILLIVRTKLYFMKNFLN